MRGITSMDRRGCGEAVMGAAAPGSDLAIEIEGCGLATPPQNSEQFAEAIEHLLDDAELRQEYSRAAYARALDRWSPVSILANFDHALHALTGLSTALRSA